MGFSGARSAVALLVTGLLVALALVLAWPAAPAGSAAGPGPTKTTVFENERVHAQINDYPPGSKGPEHEHLVPRLVVVLQGGTLAIRGASGEAKRLELEPGQVIWRPAEKHAIANPGSTAVRLVEVDIKDCPPRARTGF